VAVISGSGMAAFVILQLRSEEGWHHEDNRLIRQQSDQGRFLFGKKEQ